MEYGNATWSDFSDIDKLLVSFFHSVSTRTAGFNTVDLGAFHVTTVIFYMGLMFIGANPAGTAGGIKIPTVAVLYGYIKDWFKAPGQPVVLLNRRISKFALSHAIRLGPLTILASLPWKHAHRNAPLSPDYDNSDRMEIG